MNTFIGIISLLAIIAFAADLCQQVKESTKFDPHKGKKLH